MSETTAVAVQPVRQERQYITVQNANSLFDTGKFEMFQRAATALMHSSMLPDVVRGDSPQQAFGNLMVIADIADRWGMALYSVACCMGMAYGKPVFEGKLIAAVIEQRLGVRLEYEWTTEDDEEAELQGPKFGIKVSGQREGDAKPVSIRGRVGDWMTFGKDKVTPLKQWTYPQSRLQLAYRGAREWCRLYAPWIILGVLGDDEIDAANERSMNAPSPTPQMAQTMGTSFARPPKPTINAEEGDNANKSDTGTSEASSGSAGQPDTGSAEHGAGDGEDGGKAEGDGLGSRHGEPETQNQDGGASRGGDGQAGAKASGAKRGSHRPEHDASQSASGGDGEGGPGAVERQSGTAGASTDGGDSLHTDEAVTDAGASTDAGNGGDQHGGDNSGSDGLDSESSGVSSESTETDGVATGDQGGDGQSENEEADAKAEAEAERLGFAYDKGFADRRANKEPNTKKFDEDEALNYMLGYNEAGAVDAGAAKDAAESPLTADEEEIDDISPASGPDAAKLKALYERGKLDGLDNMARTPPKGSVATEIDAYVRGHGDGLNERLAAEAKVEADGMNPWAIYEAAVAEGTGWGTIKQALVNLSKTDLYKEAVKSDKNRIREARRTAWRKVEEINKGAPEPVTALFDVTAYRCWLEIADNYETVEATWDRMIRSPLYASLDEPTRTNLASATMNRSNEIAEAAMD